jgi:type II secretory pathway component GspD/PulD (secretin)
VLSASSESVSVLIRALSECRRLDVLARPQVMTLDNQPAFIQVGQRVPRITAVNITEVGTQNQVVLDNVGLILGVRPRISPDGLVVMEIDAEKSELGPESEGIPISINLVGDVIRSPRINTTTAQTTVAALSGQTIVLGGLITKASTTVHRRVPLLADIPVLGNLFRYDLEQGKKTELLIVMTPHIIKNEGDAERIKQIEAARIHWCLSDVIAIHGDPGIRDRGGQWTDTETTVIYPDGVEGEVIVPQGQQSEVTVESIPPGEAMMEYVPQPADGQSEPSTAPGVSPLIYSAPVEETVQ